MSNDPQQNPSTAEEVKPADTPESSETSPTPVASDSSDAVSETSAEPAAQPAAQPVAEPVAKTDDDAESEQLSVKQAAPAKGPAIQIGSQRDAADKSLSPSLPKAVREAKTSETKIPIPERLKKEEPIDIPGVTVDQLSSQWDEEAGVLDDVSMDDLMGASGDQQVTAEEIPVETRLKGTVDRIHRDDVFVNLTAQNVGVVSLRQFKEPPQPGQELDVVVNRYNAEDSLYELTVPGAVVSVSDWSDIVEGAVVDAKITKTNTGGLECTVNGIRGFIPAGQVSRFRIENFEEYVDQRLQCVVTEANPNKRNLVLSHRAILEREQAEKREQLMQTLEVGNEFDGTVTKLMDFGAFVDIGGIEGLVHISKLSWDRVTHPKDVLEEQQKIKVIVEKIDPATGKIGLSYRDTLEHPWEGIETKYPVDSIVTGTVSRLAQFGAFVRLEPGIEGLVHISELAHYRVQTVKSVVNEGDTVEVKVLNVDREGQKISLSLKATQSAPEPKADKKESEEAEEAIAETPQKPKSNKPLKGGIGRSSGGEKFGLKW